MKTYQIKAKAKSIPQARIDVLALVSINSTVYDAVKFLKDDMRINYSCNIYQIDDISYIEDSDGITLPKIEYLNPI